VIRKFEGERNAPRRSWAFGWFKVHEYYHDSWFELDPQAMSLDEIKERSPVLETGKPNSDHVQSTMASLPPGVQQHIKNSKHFPLWLGKFL
jgi:hypothetical protein